MKRLMTTLGALMLSLLLAGSVSAQELDFSPFGGASVSGDEATLVSNDDVEFSGLDFELPGPVAIEDITELSATYRITEGDCGLGAPRYQINLEDGANVFVYFGPVPNYTDCDPAADTGNFIGTSETRFDVTQVDCEVPPGNAFYATYDEAVACVGDQEVVGIQLVVDNGNIEIVVDPTVEVNFGPPTDKDQCKKGGWQDFNTPRTFKNQGDCIQFVNTGK